MLKIVGLIIVLIFFINYIWQNRNRNKYLIFLMVMASFVIAALLGYEVYQYILANSDEEYRRSGKNIT